DPPALGLKIGAKKGDATADRERKPDHLTIDGRDPKPPRVEVGVAQHHLAPAAQIDGILGHGPVPNLDDAPHVAPPVGPEPHLGGKGPLLRHWPPASFAPRITRGSRGSPAPFVRSRLWAASASGRTGSWQDTRASRPAPCNSRCSESLKCHPETARTAASPRHTRQIRR